MRIRPLAQRIIIFQFLSPPNAPRLFTENSVLFRSRTQLPFLSSPVRRPKARLISTETKLWLKSEARLTAKYTIYIWIGSALVLVILFGLRHENWERTWPTPREWHWLTRRDFRQAAYREANPVRLEMWSTIALFLEKVLSRLEDPEVDGKDIREREKGGIFVDGVGRLGLDITAKSENWRRGYYQTLMGCARAAEHLDGWVRIIGQRFAYPKEVVLGPSNPNPQPVLPESPPAPRDDEIEPAFFPPETFYMRILTTDGFDQKQRLDAALAYASWLDHQGMSDSAMEMYDWALDIATSTLPANILNRKTGVLSSNAGLPSANLLTATTALAIHHAVTSRHASALPILVSVLRARKSLPEPKHSSLEDNYLAVPTGFMKYLNMASNLIISPDYPPPPGDGTVVPMKNAKEHCEEAGIMIYIGEILFASAETQGGQEDALAWTREAVDIAMEELRGRAKKGKEAKKTCQTCLKVGSDNWGDMLVKIRAEDDAKREVEMKKWFPNQDRIQANLTRWERERLVWKEHFTRATQLL